MTSLRCRDRHSTLQERRCRYWVGVYTYVCMMYQSLIPIMNDWDSVIQISCWIGRCGGVVIDLIRALYSNETGAQEMAIGKTMQTTTVIITW